MSSRFAQRTVGMCRRASIACAVGLLCASAGSAAAQSGGLEPEPVETAPDPTQDQTGERPHGKLRLRAENVTPRKVFFKGTAAAATFEYELGGGARRNIVVEVIRRRGRKARKRRKGRRAGVREPVQRWVHEGVEPGTVQIQRWDGARNGNGRASSGRYLFRVRERGGGLAKRTKKGKRSFGYFEHKFPIRGRHTYGDGVGAPRRGHRHQGQDVFARCGTRLVAARAGKVRYRGYQGGGAGHYLVIDGRGTSRDYVYMHLKRRASVARGEHVRTGQRIGRVGKSGNSSGCHLHFELWSKPGWYEGGRFLRSVTRKLKKWDRWS